MNRAVVIKQHRSNYPNPLKIAKGTMVKIEKRECEWAGWLWCTTNDNKGWIPDNYVNVIGEQAEFLQDYDATELNVDVGEKLTLHYEVNGWHWCEKDSGKQGWVPGECLEGD